MQEQKTLMYGSTLKECMINLMRERGRIMITEKEVKKYFNSDGVGCIGPCFLELGLVAPQ